ncbi:alpha/beta fold hydrolase [Sphingomonas sp. LT1P40]|uniref:alpha/beta fold hydrolase n=1 Tax=Alteristakelama amylovorans TaxID=3096166 RepID=UPI002FCC77B5
MEMSAPLVLLPGLICNANIFAAQTAVFPGAIAWNGYRDSSSLTDMAQQLLDDGPERMSLLGHSMGARVALEVFRQAPHRVERLALVSTGTHPVQPGEAEKRHALLALGRAGGMEALVDRWLPPMVAPGRRDRGELIAQLRQMCIEAGVDTFAAQVEALLSRPPLDDLLPQIDCPTLVAVGALDVWSPPDQHAAIASAIPHARLAVVADSGHMLPAEQPTALNRHIVEWLSAASSRRPQP